MMTYKGYLGVLRIDEDERVLRGRVMNTRDMITFQGKTVEDAEKAFRDSVDEYLDFCASLGRAPEKPYSGRFSLRIRPDIHRGLSAIAEARGTSINRIVNAQLLKLIRKLNAAARPLDLPNAGGESIGSAAKAGSGVRKVAAEEEVRPKTKKRRIGIQ
jgi:predicted HicB family RNase H-like nuclease